MSEEIKEFDVVVDTLQQKIDKMWEMVRNNINADMFNIIDEIRLKQIEQLKKAIKMWENNV